jgi:hypothetical protein
VDIEYFLQTLRVAFAFRETTAIKATNPLFSLFHCDVTD